jgi:hypothetical protein
MNWSDHRKSGGVDADSHGHDDLPDCRDPDERGGVVVADRRAREAGGLGRHGQLAGDEEAAQDPGVDVARARRGRRDVTDQRRRDDGGAGLCRGRSGPPRALSAASA